MNILEHIGREVSRDIMTQVIKIQGRTLLQTSFMYPDGEVVCLYLDRGPGGIKVTDFGNTLYRINADGVDLRKGGSRADFVRVVCNMYMIDPGEGGELSLPLDIDHPGRTILRLCEAVTRISGLHWDATSRVHNPLPEQLGDLLKSRVNAERELFRQWFDPMSDPQGGYIVDFHLNTAGRPSNIFHVVSDQKSTMVSAVSNFFRAHAVPGKTMAVIAPEVGLSKRNVDRLQLAVDRILIGVENHEDDIVEFALDRN